MNKRCTRLPGCIAPSPPFDNSWSYGDCLEFKR